MAAGKMQAAPTRPRYRADHGPKAVEHRHGNAGAVLFGKAHILSEETSVVYQVHVCKQHALDWPVVPEVYWMFAGSSGSGSAVIPSGSRRKLCHCAESR